MIRIAIIGGGPAGLTLCMQLKNKLQTLAMKQAVEVVVFEKSDAIGLGTPYAMEVEEHILNLPKEIMEPIPGESHQFAAWCARKEAKTRQTSFPPRYFFGQYLQEKARQTQKDAKPLNLTIRYLTQHEVYDITETTESCFEVMTSKGTFSIQYVFLSTGHMPSTTYATLQNHPGFIHNPYDRAKLMAIPTDEPIYVIGTRLTAIDAVLSLMTMNHQGRIYMVSRNGLLPTVLGRAFTPYKLQYFNLETVNAMRERKEAITLDKINTLFWQDMATAYQEDTHLKHFPQSAKDISAYDWLNNEIQEAERGERLWQRILFALYPISPQIWSMLSMADKQRFLSKYHSLFLTYLAAFPLDNAYKIRDLLKSGKIKILSGLQDIVYQNHQYNLVFDDNTSAYAKHLINCTGPGYNPRVVPLYKKMMARGLIAANPLGGIDVDKMHHALNELGKPHPRLFAIGELTRGVCFMTTDYPRVTAQADIATNALIQSLGVSGH